MEDTKFAYVSKEECIKKGFIRLKNGGFYKLSTIEKYAISGYLDHAKYDAATLLSTADKFYEDYYTANINKISAINPEKTRVDCKGRRREPKKVLEAIDRYNKAIRILPKKMLDIVERVCCEDKEIAFPRNANERIIQIPLKILTTGLCLLTEHYNKNHKTNERFIYLLLTNIKHNDKPNNSSFAHNNKVECAEHVR